MARLVQLNSWQVMGIWGVLGTVGKSLKIREFSVMHITLGDDSEC